MIIRVIFTLVNQEWLPLICCWCEDCSLLTAVKVGITSDSLIIVRCKVLTLSSQSQSHNSHSYNKLFTILQFTNNRGTWLNQIIEILLSILLNGHKDSSWRFKEDKLKIVLNPLEFVSINPITDEDILMIGRC